MEQLSYACKIAKLRVFIISIELTHLLARIISMFQLIFEFNRAVYIINPIVNLVLAWVIGRPRYVSVVLCALVICLICTPVPLGLQPSDLGVHIRQITWAHDTTTTCPYLKLLNAERCPVRYS